MKSEILPLGSVVRLKGAKVKLIIVGFGASCSTDKEEKIYDYIACVYPLGYVSLDKMLFFNNKDIEEVIHKGYSDKEEKGFKKLLEDAMNMVKE